LFFFFLQRHYSAHGGADYAKGVSRDSTPKGKLTDFAELWKGEKKEENKKTKTKNLQKTQAKKGNFSTC
jgi:hypothetical protein